MSAGRALAGIAIASLLVAAACRRKGPAIEPLREPFTTFESRVGRDDERDASTAARPTPRAVAPADDPRTAPLLTGRELSPDLRALVNEAHAHPAVGSLEAAGCELALVMTGAAYNRFVDLRHETKMPQQVEDSRRTVVWCQRRTGDLPDCTEVAPIFARVARPKRPFQVFSSYTDPPFSPRCSGVHDAKGKLVGGEGPGYPSTGRL